MNVGLVDLRVTQDLLDRLKRATEEILAQLFETRASKRGVKVDAFKQGVDFDGGLSGGRERAFGAFTRSSEATKSTGIGR